MQANTLFGGGIMKKFHINESRKLFASLGIFVAMLFVASSTVFGMPGDPDPTFGLGGVVVDSALDRTYDSAVQTDGKIIVVGSRRYCPFGLCFASQVIDAPTLARFNADGSIDLTFGINGRVIDTTGAGRYSSILIQSNDRIVVAGHIGNRYAVKRYTVDGILDTSLSSNVPFSPANAFTDYFGIKQEPGTSKFIVAGNIDSQFNVWGAYKIARLNANGSWDVTFGSGGMQDFTSKGTLFDLAVDGSSKKIALASSASVAMTACMLNQDGSKDTNFAGGCSMVPVAGYNFQQVTSITFQRWTQVVAGFVVIVNRVVMVGNVQDYALNIYRPAIVRLKLDGTYDTSFNGNGQAVLNFGQLRANASGVAIDSIGRINVAASYDGRFALGRVNRDGTPDTTFNNDGLVTTAINAGGTPVAATASTASLQSDGKIVLAGSSGTVSSPTSISGNVAIVRYDF